MFSFNELLQDTHSKKAPSNKTPTLTKSINMDIWLIVKSNQFFLRGSHTETKLSKNKLGTGKTPFFVIDRFSTPRFNFRDAGF